MNINNNMGMNGMNNNNMGMNGVNNNNMGMNGMNNNNNMGMNGMNNNNMRMNGMNNNNNMRMNGMNNNNMRMNGMNNNNMRMNGMNNNNNIGMNGINNNNMRMNGMNNNNNMGMNGINNNNMGMNEMNNNNIGMSRTYNNMEMNKINNNNIGMSRTYDNIEENRINNNMGFNSNMNMEFLLMKNILNEYQKIKDPYEVQKNIVMKMNSGKECAVLNKNNQKISFLTSSSEDNNNDQNHDLINLHFITLKGNKHVKRYRKNMKIRDMLEHFVVSFGLSKDALMRIQFLFNATNLYKLDKNMTLNEFNIIDHSRINVIDMYDVIGA